MACEDIGDYIGPADEFVRLYDTSLPDDPLHGDIVASNLGLSKAHKKELRVRLFLLVQKSGLFPSIT